MDKKYLPHIFAGAMLLAAAIGFAFGHRTGSKSGFKTGEQKGASTGIDDKSVRDLEFRRSFKEAVAGSMMDSCIRVSDGQDNLCACYRDKFVTSLTEDEWSLLMVKRPDFVLANDKNIAEKIQKAKEDCDAEFVKRNVERLRDKPAPKPVPHPARPAARK